MERYRLGQPLRIHRKHVWLIGLAILALIGIAAVVFLVVKSQFRTTTSISQSPPVVTKIVDEQSPTRQFTKGIFTISLPQDWRFVEHTGGQYNIYTWHNTASNPGSRMLQVYVDTIPHKLGVNRVLPVQAAGNKVVPTTVSDNCADFTDQKVPGPADAPAKWQGISFLCDLANYVRDVAGTSSAQGINTVTLTGRTTGRHSFFFAYTDNSAEPDLTIFTAVLQTFIVR